MVILLENKWIFQVKAFDTIDMLNKWLKENNKFYIKSIETAIVKNIAVFVVVYGEPLDA